jgi:hypothetical protein
MLNNHVKYHVTCECIMHFQMSLCSIFVINYSFRSKLTDSTLSRFARGFALAGRPGQARACIPPSWCRPTHPFQSQIWARNESRAGCVCGVELPRAGCACDLDLGLRRGEERREGMKLLGQRRNEVTRRGVAAGDGSLRPLLPSNRFMTRRPQRVSISPYELP